LTGNDAGGFPQPDPMPAASCGGSNGDVDIADPASPTAPTASRGWIRFYFFTASHVIGFDFFRPFFHGRAMETLLIF
jgi:hypothetical protein